MKKLIVLFLFLFSTVFLFWLNVDAQDSCWVENIYQWDCDGWLLSDVVKQKLDSNLEKLYNKLESKSDEYKKDIYTKLVDLISSTSNTLYSKIIEEKLEWDALTKHKIYIVKLNYLKDSFNMKLQEFDVSQLNCAWEWEISNWSLPPQYFRPCCEWLESFEHRTWLLWAWVMCYNPAKWTPVCKNDSADTQWWYYEDWTLLKLDECSLYADVQEEENSDDAIMCTLEYAPVCGSVQVQCFTTPCDPIQETFWNMCQLNANWLATYLHDWVCED